jgi:hypothetical protein
MGRRKLFTSWQIGSREREGLRNMYNLQRHILQLDPMSNVSTASQTSTTSWEQSGYHMIVWGTFHIQIIIEGVR